jgi:tetratricopeptide (TPR) repeat protein
MTGGPLGRLVAPAALAFFAITGTVSTAVAAPKDAQAQKAYRQALEDEYLMTNFDDAEKRLRTALDACGGSGCAPSVKAKLYLGLGIVLAGGKGQPDAAREAFVKALELDPCRHARCRLRVERREEGLRRSQSRREEGWLRAARRRALRAALRRRAATARSSSCPCRSSG